MSDAPQNDHTSVRHLLDRFGQTSEGWLLHDTAGRRRRLAEMMAEHSDPLVREMGKQLRDGQATLRQLFSVPEYSEALRGGVDRLAETDVAGVEAQVENTLGRERDDREDGVPGRETPR
jgi:hypothetical protein